MDRVSWIMVKIAELAATIGVSRINQLPACWEVDVDGDWKFAVNPHEREMPSFIGLVPPRLTAIEWKGWPAGFVGFNVGVIAAGAMANEDAFIAALDDKIEHLNDRRDDE